MYKKITINISKYFFLVLFLGFLATITFFSHTHIIDGRAIVHSHPYKSSSSGTPLHHHYADGFLLFHFLAGFAAIILSGLILTPFFFPHFIRLRLFFRFQFSYQDHLNPNSFRGPPANYALPDFLF
jgi:hypothetical protein